MEKLFLLYVILIYRLNDASEDVSSSKVIEDSTKDAYDAHIGTKNASYFINPKKFLTYVEQFDKIKSLGAEVRCKLHGSCLDSSKRHRIGKKGRRTKAAKKSLASMPGNDVPDNHNSVLSPESLMSPVAAGLLPPGMGGEYTQQPGAASFGQQPQMNVKLPRGMEVPMGSQESQTLDQMQNAENDASIQNSIRAKMDFMDRANGPQMSIPGMHGMRDMAPGGTPEGLPGDLMTPTGSRGFNSAQHKASRESLLGLADDARGVPNSDAPGLSDEDVYKTDDVQGNEIKDLHKFLSLHPKYKAKDEEEESERENAAFAETEGRTHTGDRGYNMENRDRGDKDYQNERNDNRSPEKDERDREREEDREEQQSRTPDSDYFEKEHSPQHSSHHHHHHDGKSGESEPQGLGPGMGMLKPGGPEVPGLQNLLGGSPNEMFGGPGQGGPNIPDMGGDGAGPYGLPTGLGAGRFISENNKNMMESNSDYNVPKTAFSNLWKDYMLTTQSQLAEKDPSANNRHTIHHPHHSRISFKKRDFVKQENARKHSNTKRQ